MCDAEDMDFTSTVNLDKGIMSPIDELIPGPYKPKRWIPPKNHKEDEDAESDSDTEEG